MNWIWKSLFGASIIAGVALYFVRMDHEEASKNITETKINMQMDENTFNKEFARSASTFTDNEEDAQSLRNSADEYEKANKSIEDERKAAIAKRKKIEKRSEETFDQLDRQVKDADNKTKKELSDKEDDFFNK